MGMRPSNWTLSWSAIDKRRGRSWTTSSIRGPLSSRTPCPRIFTASSWRRCATRGSGFGEVLMNYCERNVGKGKLTFRSSLLVLTNGLTSKSATISGESEANGEGAENEARSVTPPPTIFTLLRSAMAWSLCWQESSTKWAPSERRQTRPCR